jgi:hypothetical protein
VLTLSKALTLSKVLTLSKALTLPKANFFFGITENETRVTFSLSR